MPAEPVVEPIDIPGVDGYAETRVKKVICSLIDKCIAWLLSIKARLRAPVKMVLPEIKEEPDGLSLPQDRR